MCAKAVSARASLTVSDALEVAFAEMVGSGGVGDFEITHQHRLEPGGESNIDRQTRGSQGERTPLM